MTDTQVRIGILGGGFGSAFQWHLHPNCIVAAVCDAREDRRAQLSEGYACSTAYASLDELLADDSLDAIAVFPGAPDHADQLDQFLIELE